MGVYNAFIPVWVNSLRYLKNIITKAEAHANEQECSVDILLNSRLFLDVFCFIKSMQTVCGLLVNGGARARLTMAELPSCSDGGRTQVMTDQPYILGFVIPNVYFHMVTAYNLLRYNGVVLGKSDFLLA